MQFAAIGLLLALGVAAVPAAAAPADRACGMPQQASDGWRVEQGARAAGFDAALLCEAAQDFLQSPRNLHGFVVERHGRLVLEAYRAGPDRSTYSLWASRTAFDQDTRHDIRSVTKSIVALLWGIAESEGAVPPLSHPHPGPAAGAGGPAPWGPRAHHGGRHAVHAQRPGLG